MVKNRSSRVGPRSGRYGVGGNYPPDEIDGGDDDIPVADPSHIIDALSHRYKVLIQRHDDLIAGTARWKEAHTKSDGNGFLISGQDDLRDAVDFLDQLKQFRTKEVEPERKRCKAPFDEMCNAVQSFFVRLSDDVDAATLPIRTAYEEALKAEEEQTRRDMRIAAAGHAQEAQQLTAQADRAFDQTVKADFFERARQQQERADALFHTAETATAAELTRIRGDFGSIGGLKTVWEWEVEELMDLVQAVASGRESIEVLTVNAAMVNTMVRKGGRQKIPGLRIYPVKRGR